MMIQFGFLMSVLVIGMTALTSDCYGFDAAAAKASADCAARRTVPCIVALLAPPSETVGMPADAAAPLPLPRPPNLGQPTCEPPDRVSVTQEVCR
jgi:hypothetical protein